MKSKCTRRYAIISVDSHQHAYMIPWIFKTLMQVIRDERLDVKYLRIPAEPLRAYLFNPSLYSSYSLTGLVKQWLLKGLAFINRKYLRGMTFTSAFFMGVMLSGRLTAGQVQKLLRHYMRFSEAKKRKIEVAFHPGYVKDDLSLISGSREDFKKFYTSPWRNAEYETLMSGELKDAIIMKEGV